MEFKRLGYFVQVAEQESLSRVSEKLRITQPSLSRQMRLLEESLDVALFTQGSTRHATDRGWRSALCAHNRPNAGDRAGNLRSALVARRSRWQRHARHPTQYRAGLGRHYNPAYRGVGSEVGKPLPNIVVGNREQHRTMLTFCAEMGVKTVIDAAFDLNRLPNALGLLESGSAFGKIGINLL